MSHTEFAWENALGQRIAAQDWTPEGGITGAIGLVHGLGEHTGRYDAVAQALNSAGFALTGFDLPGHGRSDGSRGVAAYDNILNDIDHLLVEISHRYPGQPQFLYGHSLGGALVLYHALKRRTSLKGVVASSPGLAPGMPTPRIQFIFANVMARVAPGFAIPNGLDLNNLSHDAAIIQAYKADPLVHDRVSARLGLDLITCGQWIQAHAAEFPLPLLLFRGSADHLVSGEAIQTFAQAVPAGKLTYKVWDGLYHETHNEIEKDQVLAYMIAWLEAHR